MLTIEQKSEECLEKETLPNFIPFPGSSMTEPVWPDARAKIMKLKAWIIAHSIMTLSKKLVNK